MVHVGLGLHSQIEGHFAASCCTWKQWLQGGEAPTIRIKQQQKIIALTYYGGVRGNFTLCTKASWYGRQPNDHDQHIMKSCGTQIKIWTEWNKTRNNRKTYDGVCDRAEPGDASNRSCSCGTILSMSIRSHWKLKNSKNKQTNMKQDDLLVCFKMC